MEKYVIVILFCIIVFTITFIYSEIELSNYKRKQGRQQMNVETRTGVIEKLEQYKQEELLFHHEERAKYFDEVIKILKDKDNESKNNGTHRNEKVL